MLILHGYWRSGTSYRTRIALNLKGLAYEQRSVNLLQGAQHAPDYRAIAPQGLVPALEADGQALTQSPAILEWLEEVYPEPPLMPRSASDRAVVRAMAALVACDIHPLNNLRVLNALRARFGADQTAIDAWADEWITQGFEALEALIARHGAGFCFGARPTFADCCLIPQIYSAQRFRVDLAPYPLIRAVSQRAGQTQAFVDAHPDNQPDAPPP